MMGELGFDRDGFPRTFSTPFPLTSELIDDEFRDLTAAELGRAIKLAVHWWECGEIPTGRAAAWFFGFGTAQSRAAVERHARRLAPGSVLAELRAKAIAKARNRYKLDKAPEPRGVVVPFPGSGSKV